MTSLFKRTFSTSDRAHTEKGSLSSNVTGSPGAKTNTAFGNIYQIVLKFNSSSPRWLTVIGCGTLLGVAYLLGNTSRKPVEKKPYGNKFGFSDVTLTQFQGRDQELKDIRRGLSKNNIVHLVGQAGAGKTQLALKYMAENDRQYSWFVFVDCETEGSFDKHLRELAVNFGLSTENVLDSVRAFLATKKGFLLICDNVDDPAIATKVQKLLEGDFSGKVIINGRLKVAPKEKEITTVKVGPVTYEDGLKIFRNNLSAKHQVLFDRLPRKDKEGLMTQLGSLPFMIKWAAKLLDQAFWPLESSPKDLEELCKVLSSFSPDSVDLAELYLLQDSDYRTVGGKDKGGFDVLYAKSIQAAENLSLAPMSHMVRDVLYFYGFYGKLETIPFPREIDMGSLKEVFIKSSSNQTFYKNLTDELFYQYFRAITENLKMVGLIDYEHDEGKEANPTVKVPLPLKWAMQRDYIQKIFTPKQAAIDAQLADYQAKCREAWTPSGLQSLFGYPNYDAFKTDKEYEKETARYGWLASIVAYFDQTVVGYELDLEQVPLILDIFGLLKHFNVSSRWKSEVLSTSRLWRLTKKALLNHKDPIKDLPYKETYDLFYIILHRTVPLDPVEYAGLVNVLPDHCQYYDPVDAECLLNLILEKTRNKKALFLLGSLLYARALNGPSQQEKNRLLADALSKFTEFLKDNRSPEGFRRRALCHPDHKEGWEKSIADLQEAIQLDPFNPIFRNDLANYLEKNQQRDKAKTERSIGEGLQILSEEVTFRGAKRVSSRYGSTILNFLSNTKEIFELREGSFFHSMEDKGFMFGKILNCNPWANTVILHGCDLDNAAFKAIAKSLESNQVIRSLKLEWTSKVSGEGIEALGIALAKNSTLQELSLKDCINIPADKVLDLIQRAPPQLKKIDLQNCFLAKKSEEKIRELAAKKGIEVLI